MIDERAKLTTALGEFLNQASSVVIELRHREVPLSAKDLAAELAGLSSMGAVNGAGIQAALATGYLRTERQVPGVQLAAGRTLSERTLVETGLAGLLSSGESYDRSRLIAELAEYVAGPVVPVFDYVIIDANVRLNEPLQIVDGWELVTPTAHDLRQLVGVPTASSHVPRSRSFEFEMFGGLAMLRRIDPEGEPHDGLVIHFSTRPAHVLWEPLLALSLYQNHVLELWGRYVVEPARRVDELFEHVLTEPWHPYPDGMTEVEQVRQGEYTIDVTTEPRLRRFCQALALRLDSVTRPVPQVKGWKNRSDKLRRVAEHFLTAGEGAIGEGEVLTELNADATLHYVIALEAVLTSGQESQGDLARKVTQRAAILAGVDDADRVSIEETVRDAYKARSKYAHGSEPLRVTLPKLRRVVRDCVITRLILGDPPEGYDSLSDLGDRALLDNGCLAARIRAPISAFWSAVEST